VETPLTPCTTCHRHVREDGARCPFCDAPLTPHAAPTRTVAPARVAFAAALAVASGVSLAACYGGPPPPPPANQERPAPPRSGLQAQQPVEPAPVPAPTPP
jgi:hypothetical protein